MIKGKDLLAAIPNHPNKKDCPGCGKAISNVALVKLVYAFEPCDCDVCTYKHLVETIYHRDCFAGEVFRMQPNT